ncbi:hypothetical protein [Streptomyces sp. NPDC048710]|uniref:hypothetical protein n=1 Tax=Streptomyces sp. NPDC048710 TaxID=3365586 RepID=UPI00371D0267
MPGLHRFSLPVRGHGQRSSGAGAGRALSPRGALTVHAVDGALLFAIRAALAMGLVAVPIVAAGRPDLTTTFGRDLPYARRARVLAVVAVAMTACVGCGSALAVRAHPGESATGAAVVAVATALVAGAAKYVCDATRLGGLGAVLLLFSFAVAANASPTWADVLPYTALAAAGAGLAWLLAASGRIVHPERPQRLAVAMAPRRLAEVLEASASGDVPRQTRRGATVAVLHAYQSLGSPPPARTRSAGSGTDAVYLHLTDLSWTLLVGSARCEPWPAGIDPAELAAAEKRAYVLPDRLHHHRWGAAADRVAEHRATDEKCRARWDFPPLSPGSGAHPDCVP